jgi:hypothetical protein
MNEQFEEKVRLIYDYYHGYGLRKTGEQIRSHEDMLAMVNDPSKKAGFVKFVHEGFRLGQDILIEELSANEKKAKDLKAKQKELRRENKNDEAQRLDHKLKIFKHKEYVLRNLADSLAWSLMQGQHWVARRWHSGNTDRPSLLNSNIESLHIAAAHYYKKHPDGFALYTDLTSFIDIADLIVVTEDMKLKPVEVKEGSKAGEVMDFIEKLDKTKDFKPEEMGLEKLENPNKFLDQVERVVNQMSKASRLTTLLTEEKGPDPFTGQHTVIGEISTPLRFYHEEVYGMFQELKTSIWSHRVIEGIIHIGMYRAEALGASTETFKSVISTKFTEDYPVLSYTSQLRAPIKEPIFQKPYGIDNVMSLVLGKVRMLLCVDLDALIELFNSRGVNARWMSRKETQKAKESGMKRSKPFEFKNRAIEVELNGDKLILGDGFLSRLMYDSLLPESLVQMYLDKMSITTDEEE